MQYVRVLLQERNHIFVLFYFLLYSFNYSIMLIYYLIICIIPCNHIIIYTNHYIYLYTHFIDSLID